MDKPEEIQSSDVINSALANTQCKAEATGLYSHEKVTQLINTVVTFAKRSDTNILELYDACRAIENACASKMRLSLLDGKKTSKPVCDDGDMSQ